MIENLVKRDKYIKKVIPFVNKDIIKVFIGQRRSWKSKFMLQVIGYLQNDLKIEKKKIIYIDKERIEFEYISDYKKLFEETKNFDHIFVDEIQNIPQWEKAILNLQNLWKDVYITWSNSNLLWSDLATNLRWRYIQINIYPLDYKEFLFFHNIENSKESFDKYLLFWWLPYLRNLELKEEIVNEYLKSISETIILKDIVERFSIRNINIFNNLLKFVARNVWNIFSSTNISSFLISQKIKLSPTTILDYLEYLKISFVLNECNRLWIKWKKLFEIKQKYYFSDIWIRNVLSWWYNQTDIPSILENIVFINLISNWWKINVWEINNKEVDFVCEKDSEIMYLQVCYLLNLDKTKEREFSSLLDIKESWPKYVLSTDEKASWNIDWIKWKKIRDFIYEICL
jgi:uncharacterized protein